MDAKEIESLVKANKALPIGLNIAEQSYYMSLENLARGQQSKEECIRRYKMLKEAFEDCQRWIVIYKESFEIRLKLSKYSKEVEFGTCETCKKIIRIIDGRMK